MHWTGRRQLYSLLNDPGVTTAGSIAAYKGSEASTSVGYFDNLYRSLPLELDSDIKSQDTLNNKNALVKFNISRIVVIDSLLDAGGSNHWLENERDFLINIIGSIEVAQRPRSLRIRDSLSLYASHLLGSLLRKSFSEVYETNLQDALHVYLGSIQTSEDTISDDELETLWPIANSCPAQNGEGVYIARSLILQAIDTVFNDSLLCQPIEERSNIAQKQDISDILLFPNPGNNYMLINNQFHTIKEVSVSNIIGTNFITMSNTLNQALIQLNTSELTPGIYMVALKTTLGKIQYLKWIKH